MIFTENNFGYAGSSVNRQSGMAGTGRRNAGFAGGGDFLSNISKAVERADEKSDGCFPGLTAFSAGYGTAARYQSCINLRGMLEKCQGDHEDIGRMIKNAAEENKEPDREALMRILSEHREEILEKLKNGDTGVKIQIGGMSLTEEEWEKLLESFDEAQEEIQEAVRKKSGKNLPEKRPDTTINGNTVLAPEDTGHDLKSLEELVSEAGIHEEVDEETDGRLDLLRETEGSDWQKSRNAAERSESEKTDEVSDIFI